MGRLTPRSLAWDLQELCQEVLTRWRRQQHEPQASDLPWTTAQERRLQQLTQQLIDLDVRSRLR